MPKQYKMMKFVEKTDMVCLLHLRRPASGTSQPKLGDKGSVFQLQRDCTGGKHYLFCDFKKKKKDFIFLGQF